ncbi:MAG TPA: OsmC family protein [Jatrophihabitans sp.]|nr:OsmC family protein [Jatrophihabitans sp.]
MTGTAAPIATGELTVRHLDGDQFAIDVRGHTVVVDQPVEVGGTDEAPSPTELFVGGLAGCVAYYARRYLARHELAADGLEVTASYLIGDRPARVTEVRLEIVAPGSLPAGRRDALLAVASRCTVHNTLVAPPAITVRYAGP